jgi:hypothetical protein
MLILNFTYPLRCLRVTPVEYHCPIEWVPGALSLGVKRPKREADHSHSSSAEDRNAWSYTSTPSIRLHGVVLN